MRLSYLDEARLGGAREAMSRLSMLAPSPGGRGTVTGTLIDFYDLATGPEATTMTVRRARVLVDGAEVPLPAEPGTYVLGGPVVVEVDGTRRPVRVVGPAASPTLVDGQPAVTVTHMPDLVQDEAARARNEEVAQGLERAEASLSAAQGLIEAVRERVGRKAWVGQTFEEDVFFWSPLGGGRVRFETKYTNNASHDWNFDGVGGWNDSAVGGVVEVEFPSAGDFGVEYETDDPTYDYRYVALTITAEMMDPEYGWVDMELDLADLTAPGGPLDPGVIAALWQQVVAAGFLVATEAIIGPAAIIDGGVEARHLNVVHETPDGGAVSIQPDGIRLWHPGRPIEGQPNAMWTAGDGLRFLDNAGNTVAWLDEVEGLVLGSPDGGGAQVNHAGLRVFGPEDTLAIQLGAFGRNELMFYRDGEAVAYMSDEGGGEVGARSGSFEEIYYDGTELTELLDTSDMPRGILGERVFADTRGPWTIETGVGYVGALVEPGRAYKITAAGHVRDTAGVGVDVQLRIGRTGSEGAGWPDPSSAMSTWPRVQGNQRVGDPSVDGGFRVLSATDRASTWRSFEKSWYYTHPEAEHLALKPSRWLLTLAPLTSGSVEWLAGGILRVEDVGLAPSTNSGWHMGGSSGGTGGSPTPPPPDPTPPRTRRVLTRSRQWHKSWQENGQAPGAIQNYAYQGRTPYYTTAGRYRSMVGFSSMTTPLNGADIERIEVYVKVAHGGGTGGNMTVVLGTHGVSSSSPPSNFSVVNPGQAVRTIRAGSGRWMTLPTSMHQGFKDGSLRGIVFYTSEESASYYGYIDPGSIQFKITYWA